MKFADKQKVRQAMCKRELNREKRVIRMMHEKSIINNFKYNQDCLNMYDKMMSDNFNSENLCSNEKKVFQSCQKYIMWNDYNELKDLEKEMNIVRDAMDTEEDTRKYYELKKQYNSLKKEYIEFRRELTNTEEGRRLFNLCKGIDSIKRYEL